MAKKKAVKLVPRQFRGIVALLDEGQSRASDLTDPRFKNNAIEDIQAWAQDAREALERLGGFTKPLSWD